MGHTLPLRCKVFDADSMNWALYVDKNHNDVDNIVSITAAINDKSKMKSN